MPITPTYPGVYIEEVPSGVRTIIGVATSITAFIGRVSRGPVDDPTRIQSYAVQQYFLNGGTDAIIVRVVHGGDANINDNANKATLLLPGALELEAANE